MIVLVDNRQNEVNLRKDYEKFIEDILKAVFEYENCIVNYEISISLVNNNEIKNLNKQYRNIDSSTDVLSFPMIDCHKKPNIPISDEPAEEFGKELPLGDIVISLDKAKDQAENYGHTIERELAFLLIHGALHLLGYDHENTREESIMFNKQEEILRHINFDV